MTRVAVVGAGIVGATAAHHLASRGAEVSLYERDEVGSGATGRAAGVLYDAFSDPVNARLGARAQERFRELSGRGAFEFTECPYVMVAAEGDDDVVAAVEETADGMARQGCAVSRVDPADLGAETPVVTDDLAVAVRVETAGWGDPGAYARAVASLAREAGAEIRTGTPVALDPDGPGVVTDDGGREGADAVLVAAGAHTKRVFAAAGIDVPLKPYRVQALTSRRSYDGPTLFDASGNVYLRPHPTGLLAGDGTEPVEADPDDWDRDGDDWFVDSMRAHLAARLDYDLDLERAWAGLCVATPDHDPLLGQVHDGVYVAAGWQGHGAMRGPATGEVVADEILGGDGIQRWRPSRFSGDEDFEIRQGMSLQ